MIDKLRKNDEFKPVIITNLDCDDASNMLQIPRDYLIALQNAGAIPLCVPPGISERDMSSVFEKCNGILLIGGKDYDPQLWGDEKQRENVIISKTRQDFDLIFARYAMDNNYPVLGICGGHQLINIVAGGTLFAALETQFPGALVHWSYHPPDISRHHVAIDKTCRLFSGLELTGLEVNSYHHQAVKDVGSGLRIVAQAPDGVIEAIEGIRSPVFGVQWHPEKELDDPIQQKIFRKFVSICREYA